MNSSQRSQEQAGLRTPRGWPLKKGKLVADTGAVLATGVSLRQAKELFPDYRIRDAGRRTDPLDYRLRASYGLRQ
jgi:hypothetical protein